MSHIWMEHGEHGGRALLPDLPAWRALGWVPCDGPPPEPDLTRDPEPPPQAVPEEPADDDEAPESPGLSAAQPIDEEEELTDG